MVRVHRDKLECALKMLKEGASFREIARSCGLSLTQISEIADIYGYYVDAEVKIEARIKELEKREQNLLREVKELEERKRSLAREVGKLEEFKRSLEVSVSELGKKLKDLMTTMELLCAEYEAHKLGEHVEEIDGIARDYADKLVEELEPLMNPQLIRDLEVIRGAIDSMAMSEKQKEEVKERLKRVGESLTKLPVIITKEFPVTTIVAFRILSDLCRLVKEYRKATR